MVTSYDVHVTSYSLPCLCSRPPPRGSLGSAGATGSGAFLTGLLGVGVGEVVLPQLVRGCCMPLPLAAGTSVATVLAAAVSD